MRIITREVDTEYINFSYMDEQLHKLLPGEYLGASFHGTELKLYFEDNTTNAQIQAAIQAIQNADPDALTPMQELRQFMRQMNVTADTDPLTLTDADVKVAALAVILFFKKREDLL